MKDIQFYANGRLAVLSTKLLGADKFLRLSECNTLSEAVKVLTEGGYGGGVTVENPNDYEKILMAETDSAIKLFAELCYDKYAVKYFLCRYVCHNVKVLMKRKYMRVEGVDDCFGCVGQDLPALQQQLAKDDYSALSKNLAAACHEVDVLFADGNRSPQAVDVVIDKAMFADMAAYAKKSCLKLVRELNESLADTTNLMLLCRLKKAGAKPQGFAQGGSISAETLQKLFDNDGVAADLKQPYKDFYALCTSEQGLAAAEREQKRLRNALVRKYADFSTIQPAVEYFFKKTEETDKVRMVLISVKNGVEKDKIKSLIAG